MDLSFQNITLEFPPKHRVSDYIEIAALSIMLIVGCPLNILSLSHSLKRYSMEQDVWRSSQSSASRDRRTSRRFSTVVIESLNRGKTSRVFALILHLTVANLMVLLIYGSTQIGWLVTYSWTAGNWMCKIFKFLHALCFYGTSNLMAAVALERLYIAIHLHRPRSWGVNGVGGYSYMRMLPWIGWTLAFLSAVPQFFLWHTVTPFPDEYPHWQQCVDEWSTSIDPVSSFYEKIYVCVHLILVFWLPVLIIVGCYTIIVAKLDSRLRRSYRDSKYSQKQCDAIRFRKRVERWHHVSCSPLEDGQANERRESVILLMEMPIVYESTRAFTPSPEKKWTLHETPTNLIITLTRARKSAVTKMSCVLAVYIICWTPYNVMSLWRYSDPNRYYDFGMEYLYNLIVLNAVINPLLHGCS